MQNYNKILTYHLYCAEKLLFQYQTSICGASFL